MTRTKRLIRRRQLERELVELRRTKEAGGLGGALRASQQLLDLLAPTKHQRFQVIKEVYRWAQRSGNMDDPFVRDKIAQPLGEMANHLSAATDIAKKVEAAITVLNRRG